ncbi:LPS export ABC transporter periplasmic protein LptC [Salipiger bermudensis]|uniref:LPS export ABC transporter periplasmic protein LptC n=1 Tax=Salipiger bermudensis TaxID=344736 RepID=UPI001CD7CA87|nr:LPS export ABC transporter periplasmic protein LptC [Salipiger bermudensis]MCA0962867.1 LPS export ABC transporter periplasmic protein LptC [Salipiger bermudensis]
MAPRGDTYSYVIGWLKLLLPLVALALLSTLFLVSRSNDPAPSIPFADPDNPDGPARQQILAPRYAGLTARGDQLILTADSAEPLSDDLQDVLAHQLDIDIDMSDGSRITLRSDRAVVSSGEQSADLEGKVRIESSTGYRIDTERLRTALDQIEAETLAPVSGEGPAGSFTAGKLTITPSETGEDVQLLFTEGVNLIYDPKDP